MLIPLKSPLPVLVIISSMSMLICNRFYTRRANSGRIRIFWEEAGVQVPFSRLRSKGFPSSKGIKFRHKKLESLRQFIVKIT